VSQPVLQILIASTRPGRVGPSVAEWFARVAREDGAFEVEVVDLAELDLPMMDEPNHPRLRRYTHEHTKRWSAIVDRADAFAFVHPEYNYGINAPLKNAIDYLHTEWEYKPVTLVSYGGISAGLRAAQMIKQVVTTLGMVPTKTGVPVPFVAQFLQDGVFTPNETIQAGAKATLDELALLNGALATLR